VHRTSTQAPTTPRGSAQIIAKFKPQSTKTLAIGRFDTSRGRAAHQNAFRGWARAQFIARKLPAAMMLVPSIKGVSHHWSENTTDDDILLGARVFAESIASVLKSLA
jgi:acetylornithine deacetylase/succinyl-diaminopimelate desuccinylase-like protein